MTRLLARPHRQTSAVRGTAWEVSIRNTNQAADGVVRSWDYSCPIRLTSTVEIDFPRVLEECGLGPDAQLALVAVWWSSSTNLRRAGEPVAVVSSGQHDLHVAIEPGVAGGQILLKRSLILMDAGNSPEPFAPTLRGSVLWEETASERTRMILEGEDPRFPTTVTDFGEGRVGHEHSVWWLDVDTSELDASPLATIRLYLNAAHPDVKRHSNGADDERSRLFANTLEWDVTRSLVRAGLDTPELVDGWGSFRPGSLGELLEQLIRRTWPGHDPRALLAMRSSDPGLFEARLQGRIGLLRGVR